MQEAFPATHNIPPFDVGLNHAYSPHRQSTSSAGWLNKAYYGLFIYLILNQQMEICAYRRAVVGIYESMDAQGLRQDAITCSSLISALAKGKQWALALQVRFVQPAHC